MVWVVGRNFRFGQFLSWKVLLASSGPARGVSSSESHDPPWGSGETVFGIVGIPVVGGRGDVTVEVSMACVDALVALAVDALGATAVGALVALVTVKVVAPVVGPLVAMVMGVLVALVVGALVA